MRRAVALIVGAVIVSSALGGTAHARVASTFGGAPPVLGVGLLVSAPGGAGAAGGDHESYRADDTRGPRPLFTRAISASSGVGIAGSSNLCQIGAVDLAAYPLGNGWLFAIELFVTATGADLGTIGTMCVPFAGGPANAAPAAPTPPQPPTLGEIWNAVGLPTPPVGASPDAKGITGLPTWVWTAGSPPVAVAVALAGYRVTGTARVVGYGVFPGEGGWVDSDVAGGPGEPASEHTYETTGAYRLGVATVWTATAVMTGPGLAAPLAIDLGTAIVTNGRDYRVVQIRSRLLP